MKSVQEFAGLHISIYNHFRPERHLVDRQPTSSAVQPRGPAGRTLRAWLQRCQNVANVCEVSTEARFDRSRCFVRVKQMTDFRHS